MITTPFPNPPETPAQPPKESNGRVRVLVVDDSPVDRLIVRRILEQGWGYSPVFARDGLEASALLAEDEPGVVLTDMNMPEMGGLDLVKLVRRRHGHVPVILMTANGSESTAVEALQAGAASYVPKRDLAARLHDTLEKVLAARTSEDSRRRVTAALYERRSCYRVENDPGLIRPLANLLQEELDATGFGDETTRMRVGIALTEAISNAVYHGNLEVSDAYEGQDDPRHLDRVRELRAKFPYRDRLVHVEATLNADGVAYVIRDEGPGFDHASAMADDGVTRVTRSGGRGLLLIRTFMDEVRHNPRGNEITLLKKRTPA